MDDIDLVIRHRACGVPLGEHREMQRTTIAGEFELGRVLEAV